MYLAEETSDARTFELHCRSKALLYMRSLHSVSIILDGRKYFNYPRGLEGFPSNRRDTASARSDLRYYRPSIYAKNDIRSL